MNSRNYTTKEQSKHLLELGLSAESADMAYFYWLNNRTKEYGTDEEPTVLVELQIQKNDIPCWSVGELLKLIPNYCLRYMGGNYWISFYSAPKITPTPTHVIDNCKDELDAVYSMVVWLLEHNYISKK